MIIDDHINLIPNPLVGPNQNELGTRFPDMSQPYCKNMISIIEEIGEKNEIKLKKGTYVGVTGPTLETPAEYKYFRIIGGDTVGMSTVPEVIAARHMKLKCFGISVITDLGVPGKIKVVTHEDVQNVANKAKPILAKLQLFSCGRSSSFHWHSLACLIRYKLNLAPLKNKRLKA